MICGKESALLAHVPIIEVFGCESYNRSQTEIWRSRVKLGQEALRLFQAPL